MTAAILAARETDIADHTDQPPSGDQGSKAMAPHLVEFREELIVALDVPHLALRVSILFKSPIRWRCQDQVETLGLKRAHLPCIAELQPMRRRDALHGLINEPQHLL